MSLKQIVKKGLLVGGLLVAPIVFADGNAPKVHADQLRFIQFREQKNLLHLGYDTDKDGREDVRIEYQAREYDGKLFDFYLKDCAIDKNKDGKFSDDEWVGNIPYLTEFKMGKENLLEVDPERLLSLEFLRSYKFYAPIFLEYENYESIFDSFLELNDDFTVKDDSLGGEKYRYEVDNYWINKMWPLQHIAHVHLDSYAFDRNKDWEFSEDEWVKYNPEARQQANNGE